MCRLKSGLFGCVWLPIAVQPSQWGRPAPESLPGRSGGLRQWGHRFRKVTTGCAHRSFNAIGFPHYRFSDLGAAISLLLLLQVLLLREMFLASFHVSHALETYIEDAMKIRFSAPSSSTPVVSCHIHLGSLFDSHITNPLAMVIILGNIHSWNFLDMVQGWVQVPKAGDRGRGRVMVIKHGDRIFPTYFFLIQHFQISQDIL